MGCENIMNYYMNFTRDGGFHMQDTLGRSHSDLLRVLNNEADESPRLAFWVKIDEKKDYHPTSIKQPKDSH
jgi:hypothetical protein